MTTPTPSRQPKQQNGAGIPGTGAARPNHTQGPNTGLPGGAHALAGQDSHGSPAGPLPGAAAEEGHNGPTQQRDDQAHLSGNQSTGVLELSVEEQHRLAQQWRAQGRKACSTCGAKHPPPCNPGIVKKRKPRGFETPWCKTCQEFHLYGRHVRTIKEAKELLDAQARGQAPIPDPRLILKVTNAYRSKATPEQVRADVAATKARQMESDRQLVMQLAPQDALDLMVAVSQGRIAMPTVLPPWPQGTSTGIAQNNLAGKTYSMPQPPPQTFAIPTWATPTPSTGVTYSTHFNSAPTASRLAENGQPTRLYQGKKSPSR